MKPWIRYLAAKPAAESVTVCAWSEWLSEERICVEFSEYVWPAGDGRHRMDSELAEVAGRLAVGSARNRLAVRVGRLVLQLTKLEVPEGVPRFRQLAGRLRSRAVRSELSHSSRRRSCPTNGPTNGPTIARAPSTRCGPTIARAFGDSNCRYFWGTLPTVRSRRTYKRGATRNLLVEWRRGCSGASLSERHRFLCC